MSIREDSRRSTSEVEVRITRTSVVRSSSTFLAISIEPSRMSDARRPVSLASWETRTICEATSRAACEVSSTEREISPVTVFCSSMASAIAIDTDSDHLADRADRNHRRARRVLNFGDLLCDLAGGLCGLLGERFDLGCDHREAAPGFARARRFDRGIDGEQVGLACDLADQVSDGTDLARGVRQFRDGRLRVARRRDGLVCQLPG